MSALSNIALALKKLGLAGTVKLLIKKRRKAKYLTSDLIITNSVATLKKDISYAPIELTEEEKRTIIDEADEMLLDENLFFSFRYHLQNIHDPWNYDPLEKKYWPKRKYEETLVHSDDTPRDVKIVWEINRFKDLPILAQASFITKEKKYAAEMERRMLSWIGDNPYRNSVNWSSPLEIAVRLIAWGASLRLVEAAGLGPFDKKVYSSVWQQTVFLAAALSTDKIVRSNHLIGETAGLFIISSLFDFPEADSFRARAKEILIDSILTQTFPDGVSRETSGWYHTFVTAFAELALRAAQTNSDPFSEEFQKRFERMIVYRNSIIATDGAVVKYGDFDNGKAIELSTKWRDIVFGKLPVETKERQNLFDDAKQVTVRIDKNYLFVRAGEFGWGGSGFSSHAHDDFLAPSVYLNAMPILVDPGTYVYNGNPEERDKYRSAQYHNGLIIGGSTGAEMKPSFGWSTVRPDASIDVFEKNEKQFYARASYGEWKGQHSRHFTLTHDSFQLEDHFDLKKEQIVEWNFHFHPRWRLEGVSATKFSLRDFRDHHYEFELSGISGELELFDYDFSPSYMEKDRAQKLRVRARMTSGMVVVRITKPDDRPSTIDHRQL
ncbi:MAG TPA: alginate lyase family protein [Candidatus Kapabacteria bacterium]|nr:alginate lyase family protein [Candidatus Kapabacteria bacterium]